MKRLSPVVRQCFFFFLFLVSPVLDCGHTLVGGKKVVHLTCENRGGDGKFCIMRKSCWPTASFQVYWMVLIKNSFGLHLKQIPVAMLL